ncbi:hypothetical protein [Serratia sarumanii]|uniref:hypothetical protein n=1 Tax=Serratia sarumanii TaxID=3020826 RepID=UPI0029E1BEB2|nr:hypothetical protein [Serratia marcescens]
MTTIQRFTPDYKMHAVRFEAFAREAEHGEYVRFDAHQQEVIALKAERDAQQKRADALAVENQAQSAALSLISGSYGLSPHIQSMCAVDTPTTDAALAAIRAQGVEKAAEALDALSAQSASATTQANFRAAAVYLRTTVLPAIGEAK